MSRNSGLVSEESAAFFRGCENGRRHRRRHPVKCGDLCGGAERLARRQLIKGMDCFKLSMPFFFSFSGHATGGV